MKPLTFLLLIASAAVAVGSMMRSATGSIDLGIVAFMAWAVSPYVLFAVVVYALARFTRVGHIWAIGAGIAALMLIFSVYSYVMAMDGQGSTEAIAYVVVPVFLHAGALICLAAGVIISKFTSRPTSA